LEGQTEGTIIGQMCKLLMSASQYRRVSWELSNWWSYHRHLIVNGHTAYH